MENKNSYFIAGLFFLVALLSVVGFLLFMNITSDARDVRSYYTVLDELPAGVKKDSQVLFKGVPAGYVKEVRFIDGNESLIEIRMDIAKSLSVTRDSKVVIEVRGISGVAILNIVNGKGEPFDPKDPHPVIMAGDSTFEYIAKNARHISENLDLILSRAERLMSDENIAELGGIVSNLNKLTGALANENGNSSVSRFVSNLNALTQKLNGAEANATLRNFNALVNDTRKTVKEFGEVQKTLHAKLKGGDFDFKTFLTPTLDVAADTLLELKILIKEVNAALFRLEENPYEFFFKDTGEQQ